MKQRVQYNLMKKGKKSQMNDEKIEKLDAIGFSWVAPNYQSRKRQRSEEDESSGAGCSGDECD